jgi:defect-in-organelle-trafficking protein DotB
MMTDTSTDARQRPVMAVPIAKHAFAEGPPIPQQSQPVASVAMGQEVDPAKDAKPQESRETYLMKDEPVRMGLDDFEEFLQLAISAGASDITIQSDQQPRIEVHGVLQRATRRPWTPNEVDLVLTHIYGASNARTEINSQKILDFSYEISTPDNTRQRMRVNATGILGRDDGGVEITMRILPSKTPDLDMVKLTDEEVVALSPRDGIVVIAGATGSGKSTTMAAITRTHLENHDRPVKIVDVQAPIEYTFRDVRDKLAGSPSMIGQSEVGRHIKSFAAGVHSALRRKPHIISVGEARDFETISAALEAALTGHLVYTTTHAGSVSDAMRRLLTTFPASERESRGYDLVSSLRFLMVQHLVPRIDQGGRIPVREYLRFTDRVRERILSAPVSDWPIIVGEEVAGRAPSYVQDDMHCSIAEVAMDLEKRGIISGRDAAMLQRKSYAIEQAVIAGEDVEVD